MWRADLLIDTWCKWKEKAHGRVWKCQVFAVPWTLWWFHAFITKNIAALCAQRPGLILCPTPKESELDVTSITSSLFCVVWCYHAPEVSRVLLKLLLTLVLGSLSSASVSAVPVKIFTAVLLLILPVWSQDRFAFELSFFMRPFAITTQFVNPLSYWLGWPSQRACWIQLFKKRQNLV